MTLFLGDLYLTISGGTFLRQSIFDNFPDLAPVDTGVRGGRQGTGLAELPVLFFSTSLTICSVSTLV